MKSEDFISVRLFGGLGNQIFQYMAGKSLAVDLKCKLHIDNSWLLDGFTHKNSSIADFNFYTPDLEYGRAHRNTAHLYLDRLATIVARNSALVSQMTNINAPRGVGYEEFSKLNLGVQLRGYYQSPDYFMKLLRSGVVKESSFELLQPSKDFSQKFSQIPKDGFIAIHVRGGDYLKKNSNYRELSREYYETALKFFSNEERDLPKWVFTDDESHAKKILTSIPGIKFLENKSMTSAESMFLMSKAKGIVCANSTFSYWASLLSRNTSMIIAPRKWMKQNDQREDFFPNGWQII